MGSRGDISVRGKDVSPGRRRKEQGCRGGGGGRKMRSHTSPCLLAYPVPTLVDAEEILDSWEDHASSGTQPFTQDSLTQSVKPEPPTEKNGFHLLTH